MIDFVYFGAYDLSVEYQIPGQIFDERILDDLSFLKKNALNYSKKVMAIYRTKEELEILNNININIPVASVDTSHFVNKLKAECDLFKKLRRLISSYNFFTISKSSLVSTALPPFLSSIQFTIKSSSKNLFISRSS